MKAKGRIAIFHPEFRTYGGAERKVLLIAQALRKKYDIQILTFIWEPQNCFPELCRGLNVRIVGGWKLVALLKMALAGRRFGLIHASNNPAHLAGALSSLLFGKPVIWFCNETQLYLSQTVERKNKLLLFLQRRLEKISLWFIDAIVANSRNTANEIERHLGRLADAIIYSGVDMGTYRPLEEWRKRQSVVRLLLVSRIEKHKNIDELLDMLPKINSQTPIRLDVAGDGSYLEALRSRKKKEHIYILNLHGRVDEKEKIRLYQNSDIFVFPTKDEPLGVTPVEAMACGLPVVAFNSGGVKETVGHHLEGGYLADSRKEFMTTIVQLAKKRGALIYLGRLARIRARRKFSVEQMVEKTDALYRWYLGTHA